MRFGGSNFKDASAIPNNEAIIHDWLNLPAGVSAVSLWDSLHDACVISIRSNLLERTMDLSCEIEHLTRFHKLDEGFQFILRSLECNRHACFDTLFGQANVQFWTDFPLRNSEGWSLNIKPKWREESASWTEFESQVTREDEQVFDISHAVLANAVQGRVALRLSGHLNHATYHEVYLRFEELRIVGSDGRQFKVEEFQQLGEAYWEAFSRRADSTA